MDGTQTYPVVEIFESLQGEGSNTGLEAVFLRLGGCNLDCPWCDTDWRRWERLDLGEVVRRVTAHRARALILTGGEPLACAGLGPLLARLKGLGYWIAAETNGVLAPPEEWRRQIDFLAVSPKARYAGRYDEARMVRQADEVRVVVDGDVADFCRDMRRRIAAPRYFLSPCARGGGANVAETMRLLGVLNRDVPPGGNWLLSVQAHKLAGLP